jgi:hypothetical protein
VVGRHESKAEVAKVVSSKGQELKGEVAYTVGMDGRIKFLRWLCVQRQALQQCCQLAEISAAKYKSGPIKISAAGKISGRIFGKFIKKWPKSGRTFFEGHLSHKSLDYIAEIYSSIHL